MSKIKVHLMCVNNRRVSKDAPVNVIICSCKVHNFSSSSQAYLWQLKIWLIIRKRSLYHHIYEAVIYLRLKRGKLQDHKAIKKLHVNTEEQEIITFLLVC